MRDDGKPCHRRDTDRAGVVSVVVRERVSSAGHARPAHSHKIIIGWRRCNFSPPHSVSICLLYSPVIGPLLSDQLFSLSDMVSNKRHETIHMRNKHQTIQFSMLLASHLRLSVLNVSVPGSELTPAKIAVASA